jgi:hypothetical protein
MLQLYLELWEKIKLDIKLKRNFIQKQSHWLGVKALQTRFQKIMLAASFKGGYCGVSKIENLVNICYLANYETFKQHKSIEDQIKCGLSNPI